MSDNDTVDFAFYTFSASKVGGGFFFSFVRFHLCVFMCNKREKHGEPPPAPYSNYHRNEKGISVSEFYILLRSILTDIYELLHIPKT